MDRLKKIAVLDNMAQALALESMLEGQGIPHVMKSYDDSAYDGIFQFQQGWGHIEASEDHESEILKLLGDLRTHEGTGPKGKADQPAAGDP